MGWADSYEEREEYLWTVQNLIPCTGGMWGQAMFTLKYVSCEDPSQEGCSHVQYNDKYKGDASMDFAGGAVWSRIMAQTDEDLMNDDLVDANM